MIEIEKELKSIASELAKEIQKAESQSNNEAELRTRLTQLIKNSANRFGLGPEFYPKEEYTLIHGRADAVYNRLIIEYEPPRSLQKNNGYRANQHAINQTKGYIDEIIVKERRKSERLAGIIIDGCYFIFIRKKEGIWHIEPALKVDQYSTERFLKFLFSISTEKALIPENLVKDFGENTDVSCKVVSLLFNVLTSTTNPKVNTLFEQWALQFGEVCDYEESSNLKVESFASRFGINDKKVESFKFFFCLHTYYAIFIKILAVQIVHYYIMPMLGTDLKQATNLANEQLKTYMKGIEEGDIFRQFGIRNLIEGDFFNWYLNVWNDDLFQAIHSLIATLADYSLVTLDVDPDTTRDLLKKLYQQLMPRDLRHNLGEYYTPDWLAERLLNMLEGGRFEGNPNRRILDPSCGSGTFLVIIIKKIRDHAWKNAIPESQVLEKILSNVFGFDLNPLAVISARVNYLLALGDLLQHRKGEINIPVYLCDSIMTPQEGEELFDKDILNFKTVVSKLSVPKSLVQAGYIDTLSNLLEESVSLNLNREQFIKRLCQEFPLDPKQDEQDIKVACSLYEKLLNLEKDGINGIWARLIKNAFAPLFAGEFDYIAGNPPWINWESLPEQYRNETKPLWVKYGLFPHGGMDTILGKGKKDISMIMTYVAIDKYLKNDGKLAFVITQSIFKTSGAGQGFRKFQLGDNGLFMQVIHVDDMVELNPFEGASNRTSVVVIQKGKPTKYPMQSYLYWKKTAKGKIPIEAELDDVLKMAETKQFIAEPVDAKDPTSSWITGRPKALKAVRKVLGQSDYTAHAGCYTGGANAVYWVDIIAQRPDGLVVVSNITEGAKRKAENIQVAIEPDLLYPLLRGRNVKRWKANPSAYIIMAQDPIKRKGIDEDDMKTQYPKTYMYLKGFEKLLEQRQARGISDMIKKGAPFYTMFAVGDYTFATYKVVWREQASSLTATVISSLEDKTIIPDHKLMLVDCKTIEEAYYLCGMLNSNISKYAAISYATEIQYDPHILQNIRIPKFIQRNELCRKITELSERAHESAKNDDNQAVQAIEEEIDEVSAQIWGLSDDELKEIKLCLKEISE
jgi:SAM-dependent methyltransferase